VAFSASLKIRGCLLTFAAAAARRFASVSCSGVNFWFAMGVQGTSVVIQVVEKGGGINAEAHAPNSH
jgi:hypothetical protein